MKKTHCVVSGLNIKEGPCETEYGQLEEQKVDFGLQPTKNYGLQSNQFKEMTYSSNVNEF